jgi:small subunit ribosomal protein S21
MSWVKARKGESIENLLKRFKKAVESSGILSDFKKHERYEKPSVKRKRKQAAARKRVLKAEKRKKAPKARNLNWKWNKDRTKKIPLYKSSKFNRFKKSTKPKTTLNKPKVFNKSKTYNKGRSR